MPIAFARMARTLAAMLTLTLLAAGCATTTAGVATESGRALCEQFEPIRWSARDTDETIRAAKAHNAVGARLCGWRPDRR